MLSHRHARPEPCTAIPSRHRAYPLPNNPSLCQRTAYPCWAFPSPVLHNSTLILGIAYISQAVPFRHIAGLLFAHPWHSVASLFRCFAIRLRALPLPFHSQHCRCLAYTSVSIAYRFSAPICPAIAWSRLPLLLHSITTLRHSLASRYITVRFFVLALPCHAQHFHGSAVRFFTIAYRPIATLYPTFTPQHFA